MTVLNSVYLTWANNSGIKQVTYNGQQITIGKQEISDPVTGATIPSWVASSDWGEWATAMRNVSQLGSSALIGLSDQSWLCGADHDPFTCNLANLTTWAAGANTNGAMLLQFEPAWYFFNLPGGSFGFEAYADDDSGAYNPNIPPGTPRNTFQTLVSTLNGF